MFASKHTRKSSLLSLLLLGLHFSFSVQDQDNPFAANYHDDEDDIGQIIMDPNGIDPRATTMPIPTEASNQGSDYATMGNPYADEVTYGLLNVPDQPDAEDDNMRMGMTGLNAAAAPKTPQEFECPKHNAMKYAS
jgi:hypothetical protein